MNAKKGFLRNTAVMFAAMFISKVLGAVLKIPLGNILGGDGMGYFTTAYSIFMPVLSFACAGIPTILTRAVAGYAACSEYGHIRMYRRCSLLLGTAVGIAGAALIYIAALPFVVYIANSPESLPGVLVIAPATVFCSVTAVYRGYYEGLSDMLPTAVSQVTESFVRAGLGLGMSYYVYVNGERLFGSQEAALPYAAAAALLGVTVSELCGMVYMLIRSRRASDSFRTYPATGDTPTLCRDIFINALSISLGAAASTLLALADMLTISNCIDLSSVLFAEYWENDPVLSEISAVSSSPGNFMYGCYAGLIMSVYMLAAAASGVVARCSLPRLAYMAETNNTAGREREVKLLIKGTAVITAPLTMLIAVLAGPILLILYPSRTLEAGVSVIPLAVLCAGGLGAALLGAECVVFNAYGDFRFPIKLTLIGGALKLAMNAVFIIIPTLNIVGAAISAILSNLICLVYAVREAEKRFGINASAMKYALIPLFASAVGGASAFMFYRVLVEQTCTYAAFAVSAVLGGAVCALILFIFDSNDCTAVIRRLRGKRA